MKRLAGILGMTLLLLTHPAQAAKTFSVDPQTGEVTVTEGVAESPVGEMSEPTTVECPATEEEVEQLRTALRKQQEVIRRQQEFIGRLRDELRHKEDVIQGLDQMQRRR